MTTPTNIKLFWYGPRPPISASIFHSSLQILYHDACQKRPEAAGFLMLLCTTLFPTDPTQSLHGLPNLYSIHVIPLELEILQDLIGTIQHVQANGDHFNYFIL